MLARWLDIPFVHLDIQFLVLGVVLFFNGMVHDNQCIREPIPKRLTTLLLGILQSLVLVLHTTQQISTQACRQTKAEGPEHTLIFLFSRVSSRHSFSNFSLMLTVLLSSERPWSFSFCSWSARFLLLVVSRSRRLISARSSVYFFCTVSKRERGDSMPVKRLVRSRFAFLTSRSVGGRIPSAIVPFQRPIDSSLHFK